MALNKTSAGTAILIAAETYTGTATVSGGVLELGNGGSDRLLVGYNIVINSGGTFDVNRSSAGGTVTFNSKISGAGTLQTDGSCTVAMTGSNTFSGNLVVNNGTLDYSGNSTLPGGNYTVTGGTLNTGAISKTIGTFQITGGAVTGTTGMLTSIAAYDIQAGTVGAILGGSAALNKTGDRNGDPQCREHVFRKRDDRGGTLSVGSLAANGVASNLGEGTSLALNGGTLRYTGGLNTAFNRSISLGASGGVINQSGSYYLFSNGVISGSGSLTKIGDAN